MRLLDHKYTKRFTNCLIQVHLHILINTRNYTKLEVRRLVEINQALQKEFVSGCRLQHSPIPIWKEIGRTLTKTINFLEKITNNTHRLKTEIQLGKQTRLKKFLSLYWNNKARAGMIDSPILPIDSFTFGTDFMQKKPHISSFY